MDMNSEKEKREDIVDLEEAENFVSELALQAGEILKKHFELRDFTSKSKGGVDFTTQADEEVDKFLRENIAQKYPQTKFLTEETAPKDYSMLVNEENLWVIDPLDGTTNFSRGRPHFGISIALTNKGVPRIAVVYLPMQNELYTATENSQTLLNGQKIKASKTDTLNKAWIESGISWGMKKRTEFAEKWVPSLTQHVRAFTMSGSTVFDMAKVAEGQIDGFVYCGIKPWDQAAAGLLIQKAGGIITASDGKPWNVFEQDIVASNGIIHNFLLQLIVKDKQ